MVNRYLRNVASRVFKWINRDEDECGYLQQVYEIVYKQLFRKGYLELLLWFQNYLRFLSFKEMSKDTDMVSEYLSIAAEGNI